MQAVNVISYNMSVFSAKKNLGEEVPFFASEARFLSRAGSETFFDNAVYNLVKNLNDAAVIGIQEFHPPTLTKITNEINNTDYVAVPFESSITNDAKVLTIFKKSVFGENFHKYEADLGLTDIFLPPAPGGKPANDGGRPILIILTESGYTLINFHGPNRPRLTDKPVDVGELLKKAIPIHVNLANEQFKEHGKIDFEKIIITCDSNDRAHKINKESPLILGDFKYHDGHNAGNDDKGFPTYGAKSCCYNYDSCGIDVAPPGPPASMGLKGAESEYKYTGDYVLAREFSKAVTAIPSRIDETAIQSKIDETEKGTSFASDHKLVIATVVIDIKKSDSESSSGGRRKRRTYKKCKSTNKKRKSRRRQSRHHKN